MEQLNRIELRGYVGSVSRYNGGDKPMVRLTLATSHAYKDKAGAAVIETTWHNVVAWEGKGTSDLDALEKGSRVYVCGRLKNQKYTGADGIDRMSYDVYASKLNILDDNELLQNEM